MIDRPIKSIIGDVSNFSEKKKEEVKELIPLPAPGCDISIIRCIRYAMGASPGHRQNLSVLLGEKTTYYQSLRVISQNIRF